MEKPFLYNRSLCTYSGSSTFSVKKDWAESKGEKFDFAGSFIYGIALLGIISGFSFIKSIWGMILILGGLLAIVLFVLVERKKKKSHFKHESFQRKPCCGIFNSRSSY
jgi:hypothetical protein